MSSQSKFLVMTLFFGVGACVAQDRQEPSSPLSHYLITFEHIPSPGFGRVHAMIRDGRGFVWLGTTEGLCKYDGYQIRLFPVESMRGSGVLAMESLDDGSLLLGTGKGLKIFNLRTEEASPFLAGTDLSESRITTLARDHAGMIWIGTTTLGLVCYSPVTRATRRYTIEDGLSDNSITSILPGSPDTLWIGTSTGGLNVLHRTTSRIEHYRRNTSGAGALNSDHVTALCENEGRELWVGTNDGLNVIDLRTGRVQQMDIHLNTKHNVSPIVHDLSGRMWVAASDIGLFSYVNGAFTPFTTPNDVGRSLRSVMSLYPDPVATTGTSLLLWVGTRSGVDKVLISANPFANHIRGENSLMLGRGAVLSMCEDHEGILWAGLWGGGLDALRLFPDGYRRIAHFEQSASDPLFPGANDMGDVLEDRRDNLWIGTSGGLAMLDPQRKRMMVDRHTEGDSTSLAGNIVNRIYEDRSGTIWICTDRGLSQLVPGKIHRFKNSLDLPSSAHLRGGNSLEDICEDRQSNLWVTSYGKGLARIAPGGRITWFACPGDSSGTQENWIYGVIEDHRGLFWLSTRVGLVSFDPRSGNFTRHAADQLYHAHIFGIIVDKRDDLWLSTSIGLAKYNPETKTLLRYDRDDGILFSELRSGFFKSTRGTLFVGGLDGFAEFCPDSITTRRTPPPIVITGLSIFDRALPATQFGAPEVRLSYDQNFFSFSFAALDYADPERNSYAYRMVGLDADWVNARHRNYASYTNIDPGQYVFQVKGSNSDDVWNEAGIAIKVTVVPPYWRTWWFRIGIVILVAALAYAAYRYRLQHLLHVERLRLRIAHDLHDDLGSNLSAIAMASKSAHILPDLPARAKKKLSEIYATALATSEGMKDLVWFIKPETDALDDLFLRMKEAAPLLLGETDVDFHIPKPLDSQTISVDFKRSVFLAFKESITNIAKHAQASKVDVSLSVKNGILEMVVHDDGRGFDASAHHAGTGLYSLRKRAQALGGSCEISSQLHRGTVVQFSARL